MADETNELTEINTDEDLDKLKTGDKGVVNGHLELDLSMGNTFMVVGVWRDADTTKDPQAKSTSTVFRIDIPDGYDKPSTHAASSSVTVEIEKSDDGLTTTTAGIKF